MSDMYAAYLSIYCNVLHRHDSGMSDMHCNDVCRRSTSRCFIKVSNNCGTKLKMIITSMKKILVYICLFSQKTEDYATKEYNHWYINHGKVLKRVFSLVAILEYKRGGGESGIWNGHNFANEGLKFLSLWVLMIWKWVLMRFGDCCLWHHQKYWNLVNRM
jgi:hypothetical protein